MNIEWSLVLFTIVAGAGAGLLVFAGVGEFSDTSKKSRFIAIIAALVLLVAGGCISLLHLANPANFMAAATNLFSLSPISLELIFLGLGVIVGLIYLVVVNREGPASKVLGVCGIIVGVLFVYFSGHGYQIILVRPAWATPALSFAYALSALTAGGFLFLAVQALVKDEAAAIKKVALFVLIITVLSVIAYVAYGALAPLAESAMLFWVGAVVVGGLIAACAGLFAYMKNNVPMIYVGLIAALAGGIVFRAVMWLAGNMYLPSFFDIAANSRSYWPF